MTNAGMDLTGRARAERARQVAALTQAGLSARQIARRLQVSPRTVIRYRAANRDREVQS